MSLPPTPDVFPESQEEGEPIEGGALAVFYRATVVIYFVLAPTYFWYRWLYTIEWDVPYRMYYQARQGPIIEHMGGGAPQPLRAPPCTHYSAG